MTLLLQAASCFLIGEQEVQFTLMFLLGILSKNCAYGENIVPWWSTHKKRISNPNACESRHAQILMSPNGFME